MKARSLRSIVRIDQDKPRSQHAWQVRIIRKEGSFTRLFSDSKHGGRRGALAAATKCRDIELKKRPAKSSYDQALQLKANNSSGIVGVRRGTRKVRRGKKVWSYDVWVATGTPVSGEPSKTRYFSVESMGARKARDAAIAQRKEWEKSLRESLA
jgi:hypothetical protein